jgi:hypothetical protein
MVGASKYLVEHLENNRDPEFFTQSGLIFLNCLRFHYLSEQTNFGTTRTLTKTVKNNPHHSLQFLISTKSKRRNWNTMSEQQKVLNSSEIRQEMGSTRQD